MNGHSESSNRLNYVANPGSAMNMNSGPVSEYDQWSSTQPPLLSSYQVMSSTANPNQTYMPSYYAPINTSYPQSLSDPSPDTLYGSNFGSSPSAYGEHQTINLFGGTGNTGTTAAYQMSQVFNLYQQQQTGAGDYSAWGSSVPKAQHLDPYRDHGYPPSNHFEIYSGGLRQIEQGVANLGPMPGPPQAGLVDPPHLHHDLTSGGLPQPMNAGGAGQQSGGAKSWASIASQPAKSSVNTAAALKAKGPISGQPGGFGSGRYEDGGSGRAGGHQARSWSHAANKNSGVTSGGRAPRPAPEEESGGANSEQVNGSVENPVLEKLSRDNAFNPREFTMDTKAARYFVIKSYSEDDIHRSIKYAIWCSTEHGNKRLDNAYKEREAKGGRIYLLFSVNGSGHFCGVAEMVSPVDYNTSAGVWAQDKWKGQLRVRWIYVKDVPNSQLRHIKLENNEGKPVTNSRDTQEVPPEKGRMILQIIHRFRHTTSIFDDFSHYERRQEEEDIRRQQNQRDRRD